MNPTPVILPGLHGSGAGHWQAIWRAEHPDWLWVEQRDWESPDCSEWVNRLDVVVADCPGPVVIVAHSLGCLTFAHWASLAREQVRLKVEGGFLVTPADVGRDGSPPEIRGFGPAPKCRLPVPTMLIASENDPCMTFPAARSLALCWKSVLVNAGAAGHINVASGHGPWPMGITLLNGFLRDLASPVSETGRKLPRS
jgi:predicted alpha/beta hydrolase family esterase